MNLLEMGLGALINLIIISGFIKIHRLEMKKHQQIEREFKNEWHKLK